LVVDKPPGGEGVGPGETAWDYGAGSVGGWSCVLPSHTCEPLGSLWQSFKERVAEHSTPECRPLWCLPGSFWWFPRSATYLSALQRTAYLWKTQTFHPRTDLPSRTPISACNMDVPPEPP
ncbi:hypothetical protein CHARACLAT_013657, partial [Characodon lateralis]|nr:hypothetical protein [Characodon lateralis]